MCGIVGWYAYQAGTAPPAEPLARAMATLQQRGPDYHAQRQTGRARLGHTRLSIIDPSPAAHQPMQDPSGRYTIVYNGEIYNYRALREELQQRQLPLQSDSDTEVLLGQYILNGPACLERLNGFFAFAIHDAESGELFLARDRLGIKPLWYAYDSERFCFGSELKSLLALGIPRELDYNVLHHYFALNYVPPQQSLLRDAHKVPPGHWLRVFPDQRIELQRYYSLPAGAGNGAAQAVGPDYETAQAELRQKLEAAVQQRLVSDVPLGVFLSGGIDSAVVAALAARHKPGLQTFSLGFEDPLYDETPYAEAAAHHFGTEHTVFRITYDQLYEHLNDVLDYIDEPFADASALNFYLLAKFTREHCTVALSGDGADEVFGGYMKHLGEYRARQRTPVNGMLRMSNRLLKTLPSGRNSGMTRRLWQVQKYADGLRLTPAERYWRWCSVMSRAETAQLLRPPADPNVLNETEALYLAPLGQQGTMNDVLRADLQLTLPGDMLTKVDQMSMANSLEVRVPMLDHQVIEYACSLPAAYKLSFSQRKRILQDAARPLLPDQLYNRNKQGFEVPLRGWFLTEMYHYINEELLDRAFIEHQGIFHYPALQQLWQRILAGTNGKEDWTLWAVIVFQQFYKRYIAD